MQALLDYAAYMPHGYCLFWQPWLVILFAGSDLLIFLAYSAIPVALVMFLRQRPDLRFRGIIWLFVAFITLCGLTHLISMLTLWVPVYPLHGAVKLLAGVVSAATAVVLFRMVPTLASLPSPAQLEAANRQLHAEIAAHEETLDKLRQAQQDLERKVQARTAELHEANEQLAVASREAVHRNSNLLSVVGSIARQTARGTDQVAEFIDIFNGRLAALSNATASVLSDSSQSAADFEAIVRAQLEPVLMTYGDRVTLEGPPVMVGAEAAQQLCLVIHELAINAVKYGALATEAGELTIRWRTRPDGAAPEFELLWQESEALPAGDGPGEAKSTSFGTRLLLDLVPGMLQGRAERARPKEGLSYRLVLPRAALGAGAEALHETGQKGTAQKSTGRKDAAWMPGQTPA